MNNEIKEILDRLERIDHKEYGYGFEFADSATFDEMARCFEERKKMANYITNLQQDYDNEAEENLKLSEWLVEKQQRIEGLEAENERLRNEIGHYKEVLDKMKEIKEGNK